MRLGRLALYRLAADGRVLFMDRRAFTLLELEGVFPDPQAVVGRPIGDLIIHPRPARLPGAHRDGPPDDRVRGRHEVTFRTLRGNLRWIQQVSLPARGGHSGEFHVLIRDVTRSRLAEQGLRRSEAILKAVSYAAERFLRSEGWEEGIPEVLRRLGEAAEMSRIYVFSNHLGADGRRRIRQRFEWVGPGVEPQIDNPELQDLSYADAGFERWEDLLGSGAPVYGPVRRFPPAEQALLASQAILSLAVVPIFVGETYWGFIGFDDCLTEREWSATEIEALRGAANTLGAGLKRQADAEAIQRAEEQLRHAQKMEAVGRLAGGIAHDFNNLLTGITGYGELLISRLDAGDPLHAHAREIVQAGERASALTRQLLAFSRKQVMRPQVLDLAEVVRGMEGLLRRLAGENIQVEVDTAGRPWRVRADLGQIEQVIMNLVANARDAMPAGGVLTIRTSRLALDDSQGGRHPSLGAGSYAALAVQDTGVGMSGEVQARLFEPFFTTKPRGQGTGLGLATSYGIVRQSGGDILVDSEPGKGSTFRVLLPLVEAPVETARRAPARPRKVAGTGAILLVEDEPQVRRLAREILESGGYTVMEASDGPEALAVAGGRSLPFDLVLTDMVLPNLDGRQVHQEVSRRCGASRVLYMSGYAGSTVLPGGGGGPFLQKPFTPRSLLLKVRDVLDAAPQPPPAQDPGPDAPQGR